MDKLTYNFLVQKLYSKRNKTFTLYGWILVAVGLFILFNFGFRSQWSMLSKENKINPKFRMLPDGTILKPVEKDPQHEEFQKAEQNYNKEGMQKLPLFDPNKHIKKGKSNIKSKYGRPNPKLFPVRILNEPRLQCENGELLLLLVVYSLPKDRSIRLAIRDNWGTYEDGKFTVIQSEKWKTIFVMGNSNDHRHIAAVQEESKLYGDILQGEFKDTPYETTRKFMLAANWMKEFSNCSPRFILKSEDNIFLNMPPIIGWMEAKFKADSQTDIYLGRLLRKDVPVRDANDWMYVPRSDFGRDLFPDMIESPVYFFSHQAFVKMAGYINKVTPIAVEDGYIGLLAEAAQIQPRNNDHFQMMVKPSNVCNQLRMFFIYKIWPNEHNTIFRDLAEAKNNGICPDAHVLEHGNLRKIIL